MHFSFLLAKVTCAPLGSLVFVADFGGPRLPPALWKVSQFRPVFFCFFWGVSPAPRPLFDPLDPPLGPPLVPLPRYMM